MGEDGNSVPPYRDIGLSESGIYLGLRTRLRVPSSQLLRARVIAALVILYPFFGELIELV